MEIGVKSTKVLEIDAYNIIIQARDIDEQLVKFYQQLYYLVIHYHLMIEHYR